MTYTHNLAGEVITVEEELVERVKSVRHSFALLSDSIYFQDMRDTRPMQSIIKLFNEDFEKTPRGFYDQNNIVFFIGEYYKPVDDISKMLDVMRVVYKQIKEVYGSRRNPVAVWNGVVIGKPGELWLPMNLEAKILSVTNIQLLK